MSSKPTIGVGGIVGGGVGLVVFAALVLSPFYLQLLRQDERRLNDATAAPIEEIRRVILNLDESLAALGSAQSTLAKSVKLDSARIDEILKKSQDLIKKDVQESLTQSSQSLTALDQSDESRGTRMTAGAVESGAVKYRSAPSEVQTKLVVRHRQLLAEADKALRDLNAASGGALNSSGHLATNRIKAILDYSRGRIDRNRAEFEAWQAITYRSDAESLVESVAQLQRIARSLVAELPDQVIANVGARIETEEQEITQLQGETSAITQALNEAESKIKELEELASTARQKMAGLESTGAPIHDEKGEYAKLSRAAREAEAAVDAMRNGTLSDAKRIEPRPGEDLITMHYEGGKQQLGVRDLKDRLEQRQEQLAERERLRDDLVKQKAELTRHRDEMKQRAKTASDQANEQLAVLDDLLAQSDEHHKAADQAAEDAVKALTQAGSSSLKASNSASSRVNTARSDMADAGESEKERLQMVLDDTDMKASADTLSADCAYMIALMRSDQMDWINAHYESLAMISRRTGRDAPASVESKIDDLRLKAQGKGSEAQKLYDDVAKQIVLSKARVDGTAVLGKDAKWQAQLGQAATHLLMASLLQTDEERHAQQDAAYALLTEIVKSREQSPAIQPALQALLTLQETAH